MPDYIVLMGSEDVQRAGNQIAQAASTIQQAANQIEFTINRLIEELQRADSND